MIYVFPTNDNPLRLMKACLYCAWVAAHHIHEQQTSINHEVMEKLWEEAQKSNDSPCTAQMKDGWLYADTLQGCRIRLSMRVAPDRRAIEFMDTPLSEKYQPWSTKYRDFPSLVKAATELLSYAHHPHTAPDDLIRVVQKDLRDRTPSFTS